MSYNDCVIFLIFVFIVIPPNFNFTRDHFFFIPKDIVRVDGETQNDFYRKIKEIKQSIENVNHFTAILIFTWKLFALVEENGGRMILEEPE